MVVGERDPLVDREKNQIILSSPLHIKLGLMKQLVNAFSHDGVCFAYIGHKMARISIEKLKTDIFSGP